MTQKQHDEEMNALKERFLTELSAKDDIIQSQKYDLEQYRIATSAVGWLFQKFMEKPEVLP